MSHFITLVFTKKDGRSVEELLAPYDENIVCVPYVRYTKAQAIEKVKKEIENYKNNTYTEYLKDPLTYEEKCKNENHINYLKNEFPKKLNWTDDECYKYEAQWYEKDMIDKNGDLLSTYNLNSKWDWYQIGGRWSGYLKTKTGESTNEDYVSEIDWDETVPFAYVTPTGVWHEKATMHWFAITSDEKDNNTWKGEFKQFIESLGDDIIVTAVDCHI